MREQLTSFVDDAIFVILLIVAGVTPVLFLNLTTEFYETPKLIFLISSTLILLGLWIFSWILKGKIVITRTPLDIPLLILLVTVLVSTFFSGARFVSIYGNIPAVHGSAASWITYIVLYFITVSQLKTIGKIRIFLFTLFGSASIVAILTLMSFFQLFLPLDFARVVNFTPTGSTFSTVAFLLLMIPIQLTSIMNPNKYFPVSLSIFLAVLFGATIVFVGSLPTLILLLAILILYPLVSKSHSFKKSLTTYMIPAVIIGLITVIAYMPLPSGLSFLRHLDVNEIQLPFDISWKVSVSSFRDAPFIGTGPSTYLFNFTQYKPVEFNNLEFWNFSFGAAYNEFLQILATLGIFGLLGIVTLSLVVIRIAIRNITNSIHEEDDQRSLYHGLALAGIAAVILFAFHSTTLVSLVTALFIFAALIASQKSIRDKVSEFSIGIKASTAGNKQFDLLPIIIFIIYIIGGVALTFRLVNAVTADYYHRLALNQSNQNGRLTYQHLQEAESRNPFIDLYRVDMAQTNFALANAIAIQKGPTAENPEGTLTDEDRQTIQTLLSQAITEGRVAVTLNPRSSRNWEVLGSIYRNITGVANNALTFSLNSYGQAIRRDPLNPILRVNVGGVYYSAQNYDMAIRFFTDAANLKSDYVNAYYNLALAYRQKGELENATVVAQQAVALLADNDAQDSQSYQQASQLLEDIRNLTESQTEAPAAQTDSALSGEGLPEVDINDLDNPPDVATPAAVNANPNTNIPQPTPTPTISQ